MITTKDLISRAPLATDNRAREMLPDGRTHIGALGLATSIALF